MLTLAVILARAGSKGLPDKCVRPLLGRPLVDYTIDHALGARRVSAVLLTTDSQRARELALARGIEVIDRPPELAGDTARIDEAVRHAVLRWEDRHRRRIDAGIILYANIPIRAADAIDRAIQLLAATGCDSVRSVAPVGKHHPDWLHRLEGDRLMQFRPNSIHRRQELEPLYCHDGAVVAVTRAALFEALRAPDDPHAFFGRDRRAIVQRPQDAVDVDNAVDLALAEALLRGSEPPECVRIGPRRIGAGHATYIIAEAGVNHDGSLDKALALVDAGAAAGADAVKFQIFRAAELASAGAAPAAYQRSTGARSQRQMLAALELDDGALRRIQERCCQRHVEFLATPFSVADLERLLRLNPAAIKIASGDLTDVPLLTAAARTGLPLIVSTGASTEDEICMAVAGICSVQRELPASSDGGGRLILLHCISAYPTPLEAANLRAIATLRDTLAAPVGFSDHTISTLTGAWAAAAGACVLEKHFTLDRTAGGPDHGMSLDLPGLRDYIGQVRALERALGDGRVGLRGIEDDVRRAARKSIVATRAIAPGTLLSAQMLAARRPGEGIPPSKLAAVIGRRSLVAIEPDTPLQWSMIE